MIINVRKLALDAILKIVSKKAYSNNVVNEFLKKYTLTENDRKFFTILVYGTVERLITIDYYLNDFLRSKPSLWILNLLRLSVYQLVWLKSEAYAVINEAVEIAKFKDLTQSRFVNGVLRNFTRTELKSFEKLPYVEKLSVKYSYPVWLVSYLRKDYDDSKLEKILESFENDKLMEIRVNTLKSNNQEVENELNKANIRFMKSGLVKNGYLVDSNIQKSILHRKGKIVIQNITSQIVGEVVNPIDDIHILDLCAAPGGKSAHLAALMNNHGIIYACDIYPQKLKLMDMQLDRLGVENVKTQLVDARSIHLHVLEQSFDQILADVPCSGLGTIEHKVDLKYNVKMSNIEELIKLQKEILDANAKLVKRGGFFTYSTCTINKEENENQISNFLNKHSEFEKIEERLILPYEANGQGFYVCKMRKI